MKLTPWDVCLVCLSQIPLDSLSDFGHCGEEICNSPSLSPLCLSVVSGRDLWEFRGYPSGALEAAVAGEWHSALSHPSPGWQPEPARANRRPGQRFCERGAPHPAHLCHGKTLYSGADWQSSLKWKLLWRPILQYPFFDMQSKELFNWLKSFIWKIKMIKARNCFSLLLFYWDGYGIKYIKLF